MCFRPAIAEEGMLCPLCGKKINSVMGSMPYECPWCEEDIKDAVLAFQAGQSSSSADGAGLNAPDAPAAPIPPSIPAAPSAPLPPK